MLISAKTDYALRALCLLAASADGKPIKAAVIATAQAIPRAFLDQVLLDLRRGGMLESRRGPDGGHRLARPPAAISVADVVRAIDGHVVLGKSPRRRAQVDDGVTGQLQGVSEVVRAALRTVLECTTIAQLIDPTLPREVPGVAAGAEGGRALPGVRP